MTMLKGYKTYITAGLAVISAAAAYAVGDMAFADALQLAFTGAIGAFLRNAVNP
jgi:hypothetical protein